MSRMFTLAALAILLVAMPVVLAQDAGKDPIVAGAAAKIPAGLDKLLEAAMRNNPDVLLAQAGVSQAQAALNQTRLEVAQRVAGLFHERRNLQRIKVDLATEYKETKAHFEAGVETQAQLRKVALAQAEADAKLAQVESEIRYVLGVGGTARMASDVPFVRGTGSSSVPKRKPTLPRALLEDAGVDRQLLATLEVAWKETPIGQVVADLQKATGGELAFVLHGSIGPGDYEITLNLPGKVKVAHALSALADQLQDEVCFVFRDYGVLVAETDYAQHLDGPTIPAGIPLLRK